MCCPSGLQTGATLCGSGVYKVVAGRVKAVTFEPSLFAVINLPVILFQAVEDDAIAAGLRGRILIAIFAEHDPVLALVGDILGDLEAGSPIENAALGPTRRERVCNRCQILVAPTVAADARESPRVRRFEPEQKIVGEGVRQADAVSDVATGALANNMTVRDLRTVWAPGARGASQSASGCASRCCHQRQPDKGRNRRCPRARRPLSDRPG